MIKRIVLICFICFCSAGAAKAVETGLYLSPKFIFSISDSGSYSNGKRVNNLHIGAGASIGYNFNALSRYSPIRTELEYLYRGGLKGNAYSDSVIKTMNSHTFLFGAYYDFNFFNIDYSPSFSESREAYRNGKRALMTVYLGLLLGGGLDQYVTHTITELVGMVNISHYYNRFKFVYGFALGFAVNITPLITADIGYRILLDVNVKMNHDVIAALRLNF